MSYPSPGPWEVDYDLRMGPNFRDLVIRDREGKIVALVFANRRSENETSSIKTEDEKAQKNAEFIVRAVNLAREAHEYQGG